MKSIQEIVADNAEPRVTLNVQLGPGVTLNVQQLIDDRLLLAANSGGGKSHALRKIIELVMFSGDAQVIVFDVEGEFHTLRERYKFGLVGPYGDAPASVATAGRLAEKLVRLGTSMIIDISDLKQQEAYIAAFLSAWMSAPREFWHDAIIVIDEAHRYCPEGQRSGALGLCQDAILDLMKRGRKRGFAGLLATQRIAELNKGVSAECNSRMLGRCKEDIDIERAAKSLGVKPRAAAELFSHIHRGDFLIRGEAIHCQDERAQHGVQIIHVGQVVTTHPKRGQQLPVTATPETVRRELAELKELDVEAETEAKEIDRLRARVAQLEKDTASGIASQHTPDARREAMHKQAAEEYKLAWEQAHKAQEIAEVDRAHLLKELDATRTTVTDIKNKLAAIVEQLTIPTGARPVVVHAPLPAAAQKKVAKTGTLSAAPSKKVAGDIPAAWRRILTVLVHRGALPPNRLAIMSGYTTAQKGFTNYLSAMRTKGLIEGTASVEITPQGRAVLGPVPPLPTGQALLEHWLRELDPSLGRILAAIWKHYPNQPTVEQIAKETGYSIEQKGFSNYLSKLRSFGLIGGRERLYTFNDMHQ